MLVVLLLTFVALSVYAKDEKHEFVSLQEDIDAASARYGATLDEYERNASNVDAFYKYEEFRRRFTVLDRQMNDMDERLKVELLRRNTDEITRIHRELKRANQRLTELKAEYDEWISSSQ